MMAFASKRAICLLVGLLVDPQLVRGLVTDTMQMQMQMHFAPHGHEDLEAEDCHTAVAGDECYEKVMWAMNTGIVKHPEWYPSLTKHSSVVEFQRALNGMERLSTVCRKPCEAQCRTSVPGDECYEKVLYAMNRGIEKHPGWYPTLTNGSNFHEVQAFLHSLARLSEVCAKPCEGGTPAKLVGSDTCRSAVQGDDCFVAVEYAMKKGFPAHPNWYPTLTADSTFEEFQEYLHSLSRLSHVCAKPCRATKSQKRLAVPSSVYPTIVGYSQTATNCECSSSADRYDDSHADSSQSVQKCAEWCNSEDRCKSFGYWGNGTQVPEAWRNHCRLYYDFCNATDGWANDTTCTKPTDNSVTASGVEIKATNVVYNRDTFPTPVPSVAPTPGPTLAPTPAPTGAPTPPTPPPTPSPPTPPPTPAPTLEPGQLCPCEKCAEFVWFDLDGDKCINREEASKVPGLENFDAFDTDLDGCINKTECEANGDVFPTTSYVPNPGECDAGFYLDPVTRVVCLNCIGGAVRRRNGRGEAGECTPCSKEKFDAGEFDDCIGGIYLTEDAAVGSTNLEVNKVDGLYTRDLIFIATRVPNYYEEAVIAGLPAHASNQTSTPYIILDKPLEKAYKKYDAITPTCSFTDGSAVAHEFPCGCGTEICEEPSVCHIDIGGAVEPDPDTGRKTGTGGYCEKVEKVPTPYPTVSAKGDPHLVNLQGEHFDINHGGEFDLLRIPKDTRKPAEFVLKASIHPEFGKPCTTFITEVEFTGMWFDHKVVKVRSYLQSHSKNESDKFLGIQQRELGEQERRTWTAIADWSSEDLVLSSEQDTVEVVVSKTQWSTKKRVKAGMPTLAGQFVFYLRHKKNSEAAKVTVRQDLPGQEHLNVAVRRLSALGRDALEVGGLLGFSDHATSLEEVTPECQRHRDGLDGKKGPQHEPVWKTRWNKIKELRKHPSADDMRDNEAAASLMGASVKMCVCSGQPTMEDGELAEDDEDTKWHGVITDLQTARLAEVSWD